MKRQVTTGSLSAVIYKYLRYPIVHEGELDPRLTFNDSGVLEIGNSWNLPSSYITALCVATMVAPENRLEHFDSLLGLTLFKRQFRVNELWGAEVLMKSMISWEF